MSTTTDDDSDHLICPTTPDSESIRRQLAVHVTAAAVLRA
jgi:hypothetical protein